MDIRQKDKPDAPTYFGIFVKMEKGVSFLVSCDPLNERFDDLDLNLIYSFTFFRGAEAFTFDAKILERKQYFQTNTLLFNATSLMDSFNRRGAHRVRVQVSMNVYLKDDEMPDKLGELICSGPMHDVSRGGLTLLTNEKINLQLRKVYMSEFVINQITFRFPIEYVRGSERSLCPLHRYDYAFMYNSDGGDLLESLNRLTLALFEHQLKGGR
jgi:hypothetical protein